MSAGRKPKIADVVDVIDAALDQPKIANAMVQMRSDGVDERQARDTGIFQLGIKVGAIQMGRANRYFLRAAEIRLFEEIKESKQYKDLALKDADGNLRTAENLQDFCKLVFGTSYSVLAEESQNLQALGDEAYEATNRLGLNRKQLRLIRSLPDAQRTAVAEAIQAESKAEVVAIIEDLAAQLAQAHNDMGEAKLEKEAADKLLADKNAANDKLKLQLRKHLVAATDWPDAFKVLMDQAQFAHKNLKIVIGSLDAIREEAMKAEPQSPDEEASLTRAREVLAEEMLSIHKSAADYLEALGMSFDKTLGSFASKGLYQ